jgi:signal transduction histidine kinase
VKIRLRLTLWFFTISLLILLVFSLGTYLGMQRLLFEAVDKELDILASSIERSYDPFFDKFSELDFFHENDNIFLEYYLIVYNQNAIPIYTAPLSDFVSFNVPLVRDKMEEGYTLKTKISRKIPFLYPNPEGEITFRLICRQLFYNNQRVGWITMGVSIERIDEAMQKLLNVLLGSILIGILFLASAAYFLTRKALHPVNIITQKANQISQNNLEERIKVPVENDELGQLSHVLNNLLDRLHQAFMAQQQFLADAAHELKTPLSVLRAHWEGELNNTDLSLDIKEKLVQDVETISRLSHLINNLLLLSKTEMVRSTFEFTSLYLDEIISEVLNDVKVLADMKNQKIEVVDLQRIKINGDRMRLYQLFFNIMDNAIRYGYDSGKIWISVRVNDHWNIVEIRDNGPGIPADDLPHIFDRFYRARKDRARKTGGSGLGLSISLLIAHSHDGEIEVESETGKGSVFRVKLPLRENKENSSTL